MSCAVCCETYSQEPVICGFCDFAACNTCCETYILDQTSPKCMNTACGKDWSRKFLVPPCVCSLQGIKPMLFISTRALLMGDLTIPHCFEGLRS